MLPLTIQESGCGGLDGKKGASWSQKTPYGVGCEMNRRLAIKMLAAAALSNFVSSTRAAAGGDILELDCANLIARINDGSLRAEQVCARFLQQYEDQRALNVVTWINPSQVLSRAQEIDRSRARGNPLPALAGLPILIKDNIDTVGFPTSAGTVALKEHFPKRNAPVVERLVRQGAIIMGKANMHELAAGCTSSNPTFGAVRNPYDLSRTPGGSSGGSAAGIAARIVPAALGTDSAGSLRIPAAYCGVVGLRPSVYHFKVYSQEGVVPLCQGVDTIGPMGRSVADVSLLHAAITGRSEARYHSLENVRIGVPRRAYWDDLHPEIERIAESGLARLRDHGAALVEIDMHEVKAAAWDLYFKLICVDFSDLENFLRTEVPSVSLRELANQISSRDVRAGVEKFAREERGGTPANPALLHARDAGRDAVCAAYRTVFQKHGLNVIVFPTAVVPPPLIQRGGDNPDDMIELNGRMLSKVITTFRNTLPTCALGAPGLTLPVGLTRAGVPVALEFDGLPGSDSALLALGAAAEAAIGRVPPPLNASGNQWKSWNS